MNNQVNSIEDEVFAKIKKKDLAAELGLTKQAVSNWTKIPSKHYFKVSQLTGIPLERFYQQAS